MTVCVSKETEAKVRMALDDPGPHLWAGMGFKQQGSFQTAFKCVCFFVSLSVCVCVFLYT